MKVVIIGAGAFGDDLASGLDLLHDIRFFVGVGSEVDVVAEGTAAIVGRVVNQTPRPIIF